MSDFSYEKIPDVSAAGFHCRVRDKYDNRVATCWCEGNAIMVVAALNGVNQLKSAIAVLNGTLAMAVDRLGGMVEGKPTHEGNFLQRIDELVALEGKVSESRDQAEQACLDSMRKEGQR